MAANSFQKQVEQAKSDIRSIVQEMKEAESQIIQSSKNIRTSFQGAFNIKSPNNLVQLVNSLNSGLNNLNSTLSKQTNNVQNLNTAKTKLKNATAEEIVNQRKLAKNADLEATANSKLVGAYDRLNAKRKQAITNVRNLTVEYGKNSAEVRKAKNELDRYQRKLNEANKVTSNFSKNSLGGMVRGFKNLVGAFGIVGGATLLANLGRDIFDITKKLESLNFTLKAVTSTEEEFARTQMFLRDISQRYGVEIVSVTERYTKFLAAAQQSNLSLSKTEEIFDSVTKASGVLGLKTDELTGVYLALEQMLSKGKVTTEELRRQLGERLPGAFGIMAKAMGVSVAELDKMLKKGEILSSEALPKFARELEKAYGIEAVDTIDTLVAAQNRLSNSWIALVDSFNNSEGRLTKFFKFFLNGISDILELLTDLNTSDEALFERLLKGIENEALQEGLNEIKVAAIGADMAIKDMAETMLSELRYKSKAAASDVGLLRKELEELKSSGPNNKNKAALEAYKKELNEITEDLKDAEKSAAAAKGRLAAAMQLVEPEESSSDSGSGSGGKTPKKKGLEALKDSIGYFEKKISLLEEEQKKLATNSDAYNGYAMAIEEAKNALEELKRAYDFDNRPNSKADLSITPQTGLNETGGFRMGSRITETDDYAIADMSGLEEKLRGIQSELDRLRDKSEITGKEMKEIFGEVTETFADMFDLDVSKFDFLFDELENSVSDWADLTKELIGTVLDATLNKYEIELQAAQRSRDLILENELATEKQKRLAREKFDREERRIKTERAKQERKNNLIKIAVDTAVAVVKALASSPPPANFVLAGIVGALGIAQAAIVASQPLPKFAEGHLTGTHSGKALINDAKRKDFQEVVERGNGQVEVYRDRNQVIDMKRGDKVHKSFDRFLDFHDIEKDIFSMNVREHAAQLSMFEQENKMIGELSEMKATMKDAAKRMEQVAKRPVVVQNKVIVEQPYTKY